MSVADTLREVIKGAGGAARELIILKERFDRQDELLKEQARAIDSLREAVAALATRVAVLEEGRKTIAAEVKTALTETLGAWERKRLEEEIATLKQPQKQIDNQ